VSKPAVKTEAVATAKDGRFIAYNNGTVLDTRTNLMWAAKDNGRDIDWRNAKFYCESYRGGGYTDWRMPTMDELEGLYDERKSRPAACARSTNIHAATKLIDITCHYAWSSETGHGFSTDDAAYFPFHGGERYLERQSQDHGFRALPVRSGK
jgi:hypothetical protein